MGKTMREEVERKFEGNSKSLWNVHENIIMLISFFQVAKVNLFVSFDTFHELRQTPFFQF